MSVEVRPARRSDAPALADIYAPMVLGDIGTFELVPPSGEEMALRMSRGVPWLVVVDSGVVVGYAYGSEFRARAAYRWTVETSVRLAPGAQGRGVGRLLYAALLDVLTEHGYASAVGVIALPNAASVALHERLGFVRVGALSRAGHKHGRWVDVELWQRALADLGPVDDPPEPRFWTC